MAKSICTVCEKGYTLPTFNPFCSKRCADIDLGRWMKGSYNIPGIGFDVDDEAPSTVSSQDEER